MSRDYDWVNRVSLRVQSEEQRPRRRDRVSERWEREVDPLGVMDPKERRRKADYAMRIHMLRMSKKSSQKRAKPPTPKQLKQESERPPKTATLRRHGITQAQYDEMLERQGGKCALCDFVPAGGRRLCIDHDHATGRRRGLLCGRCNTLLGGYEALAANPALGAYLIRPESASD